MEPNTTRQVNRALPQVWKQFFRLKFGEKFEIAGIVYQKENFFCAVRSVGTRELSWSDAPLYRDFWPWTKVRTTTLVRDALPGGLNSQSGDIVFVAPPPLGERVLRDCALKYEPIKDDERTGPSA